MGCFKVNYIKNLDKNVKRYFKVLEKDFPEFLNDYINTDVLLKQQYISVTCGTIFSNLFESSFFYSSLDHSIAVALIVWHFTHDKKQTLAGLFHDIATPAFKHCIDFLNGDYLTQESTEDLTTDIIKNSKELMALLKRDNIKIEEVNDYHIYPIADNDTPKLSADRLEYSLSNALFTYNQADISKIEEIYNNIKVGYNEDDIKELSFQTEQIAKEFVRITSILSRIYMEDRTRYSMEFLADIIKKLNAEGLIEKDDLYHMSDIAVVKLIENSKYKDVFDIWKNASFVKVSKGEPKDVYYVHLKTKIRYIDPLVDKIRISKLDKESKELIDNNLNYNMEDYVYLDFNF